MKSFDDEGINLLVLHQRGECGEVGPCPYCEEEEWDDECEEWDDED